MKCDYKLENLISEFCKDINKLKDDPFESDIVITQSSAMQSYLNRKLATINTIAINIDYIQPRNFICKLFKLCEININEKRFEKETLTWKIYSLIPELENNPIYTTLKNYIENDINKKDIRRYQLSKVIADIFDNYVAYRGKWLESWQEGKSIQFDDKIAQKHQEWQKDLWQRLCVGKNDLFLRATHLIDSNIQEYKDKLPKKIYIFGISNLPKDYIEFFSELRNYIDIHFYYLGPCCEYWAEVNRKSAVIAKIDNKLLASWGQLGRDFFSLLLNYNFNIGGDETINYYPDTILGFIQRDILYNTCEDESHLSKNNELDNSITINSCYSRMREVEVLYEYILHLLNENENINPSDIVILAPNIEEYSPYTKAIFDNPEENNKRIPFSIADSSLKETSKVVETFMNILNIFNSKMLAQDIYNIISSEAIVNKYKLSIEDLAEIHTLIINSNTIWGKDCEHRKSVLDQDFNEMNSWEFGFNRLFAGYAFDSENIVDYKDILPLPLQSSQGLLLGKLKTIVDDIFKYSKILENDKTVDGWYNILLKIVNDFFTIENNNNEELKPLYDAINLLNNNFKNAEFANRLSLDIIKDALLDKFSANTNSTTMFVGGLTFCKLLPMRNIPFKIVAILGMNEGEFPRLDKQCGFDLMQKKHQLGDRSMRKDDRYIFLETLMACQEKLYLSYIGQNINDNANIPPSILISELTDYISSSMKISEKKLITKHPLQQFNKKYFQNSKKYFSYSNINYQASQTLNNIDKKSENTFCDKELKLPSQLEFSFNDFINFFICPTKFFLNHRLNINLYQKKIDTIKDCENFSLDNLEDYKLKDNFMSNLILNKQQQIKANQRRSGVLPYGEWGEDILDSAENVAEIINDKLSSFGKKREKSNSFNISYENNDVTIILKGEFDNIYVDKQVFYRPSSIKNKDELKSWIWHQLALQLELNYDTHLLGYSKGKLQEKSITSIKNHFDMLMLTFICGLRKPIPLFLESSAEYAIKLIKDGNSEKAFKSAINKWEKGYNDYGYDLQEEANRICFGDESPLLNSNNEDEFISFANDIYGNIKKSVISL